MEAMQYMSGRFNHAIVRLVSDLGLLSKTSGKSFVAEAGFEKPLQKAGFRGEM